MIYFYQIKIKSFHISIAGTVRVSYDHYFEISLGFVELSQGHAKVVSSQTSFSTCPLLLRNLHDF